MKVYLTGPLNLGASSYSEMLQAIHQIPNGIEVSSPMDVILSNSYPENHDEAKKSSLRQRIQMLLQADLLVTMDHCDMDDLSKCEVNLARTANFKVVPYWKFMQEHGATKSVQG